MDSTCKTCKFWGRSYRECCDLEGIDEFKILVTVSDDTNLEVKLRTGPDFGCVRHEPKAWHA